MNSIKQNDCSICIEPLTKIKSKELNCKHKFHIECIQNWYNVNHTCPICRTVIDSSEIDKKNKKINIDKPYYIEIITDYTTLPSTLPLSYQTTNQNNNNNHTNSTSSSIIKKHLVIILNIFIFLGIVGSFTANIFCQNNFINEIKKYIEYTNNNMNDSNNTDTLIIDYNYTVNDIDYNNSIIDYNNTYNAYYNMVNNNSNSNITIIDNEPGSDTFYILFAIAYMCCMLILTINYISIKTMESNHNLNNNYIGFYIITIIMFCTHLYYIADVFSYMNEYKYPNIKEYGNIEELYHTYLITSMTSLSILLFSFLVKIKENLELSFNCCYNMFIYCLLCCKCKCY
jgi:hypothetical protein